MHKIKKKVKSISNCLIKANGPKICKRVFYCSTTSPWIWINCSLSLRRWFYLTINITGQLTIWPSRLIPEVRTAGRRFLCNSLQRVQWVSGRKFTCMRVHSSKRLLKLNHCDPFCDFFVRPSLLTFYIFLFLETAERILMKTSCMKFVFLMRILMER